MTTLTYGIATADLISEVPAVVFAPPNPDEGDLVLVKPLPAAEDPYWGLLLAPTFPGSEKWTVRRLSDQEFSDHIKSALLEKDRQWDESVEELLAMC